MKPTNQISRRRAIAAGAAAAEAAGGAESSAEAARVKSRLPARIIPKTTAARTSAVSESTLVLVCMFSLFITTRS